MELTTPRYRTDYVGETLNGYSKTTGEFATLFVKPRENLFVKPFTDTAVILGNGMTRNYPDVQMILGANSRKVAEAYKLVYACNRAVYDETAYDYYVVKHRVFLSNIPEEKLPQIYLPSDIFLDYKNANLLPYMSWLDSGTSAAYLACFDGHKKVFLIGFDGDCGRGYQTVYDDHFPYNNNPKTVDYDTWKDGLTFVMKLYRDVEFIRLQIDGQASPDEWRALPNYKDVNLRQAVLLGDF